MNQYWIVSSSPLNFGHLLNDISDHLQVGASAIKRPVGHMELGHLVGLVSLVNVIIHSTEFAWSAIFFLYKAQNKIMKGINRKTVSNLP